MDVRAIWEIGIGAVVTLASGAFNFWLVGYRVGKIRWADLQKMRELTAALVRMEHAGSASVAFATTFNGITMQSWSSTAAQGLEHLTLLNTGSASCAIEGFALSNAPAVVAAGAGNVASGLSWASGQVINFTFNVANTDTVTGMQFVVELIQ